MQGEYGRGPGRGPGHRPVMTTGARRPRECDGEVHSQPRQRTSAMDLDTSGPCVAAKTNPDERTLIQRIEAVLTVLD